MATIRTITIDLDARYHEMLLADLRNLADMLEHEGVDLETDPGMVAARLLDLADSLTIYAERRT